MSVNRNVTVPDGRTPLEPMTEYPTAADASQLLDTATHPARRRHLAIAGRWPAHPLRVVP
jgi:hypothetical protein